VIIWDKGTWRRSMIRTRRSRPAISNSKCGHKMHGRWVLVRMKGKGEKQEPWLLIKENDEYARPADEFSVVDEMPDSVRRCRCRGSQHCDERGGGKADERAAPKAALPEALSPQLATLVDAPPASAETGCSRSSSTATGCWRASTASDIRLITRNGNDWTHKLQPLRAELKRLKLPSGWYDGEIVVHDEDGRRTSACCKTPSTKTIPATSSTFCSISHSTTAATARSPLVERRAILQDMLAKRETDNVRFSTALARRRKT
jgi:bifunctional non-homologous end joining protein LigD